MDGKRAGNKKSGSTEVCKSVPLPLSVVSGQECGFSFATECIQSLTNEMSLFTEQCAPVNVLKKQRQTLKSWPVLTSSGHTSKQRALFVYLF